MCRACASHRQPLHGRDPIADIADHRMDVVPSPTTVITSLTTAWA